MGYSFSHYGSIQGNYKKELKTSSAAACVAECNNDQYCLAIGIDGKDFTCTKYEGLGSKIVEKNGGVKVYVRCFSSKYF